MIRKPPLSEPTDTPFLSTTSASIVGNGREALPGLSGRITVGLIRICAVSVCHHVSIIGNSSRPIFLRYHSQASGLIGLPTLPRMRMLDRSCLAGHSSPKRIRPRIAVGEVYRVVTLYFSTMLQKRSG